VYLLDTNICIFAIKNKSVRLLNRLKEKTKVGLYLSALTVAELEYGCANSQKVDKNRLAMLKFLSVLNILPFGDSDAVKYGQLRADLKRRGELIGPIDMLLAAQALANELIFVTNNTDEFKRVAGLKIEDWSII
jgi:tRNA(fMet)-specific endonuclease VapC